MFSLRDVAVADRKRGENVEVDDRRREGAEVLRMWLSCITVFLTYQCMCIFPRSYFVFSRVSECNDAAYLPWSQSHIMPTSPDLDRPDVHQVKGRFDMSIVRTLYYSQVITMYIFPLR